MAYNNIYPVSYQPFYQPQPTSANGIIWVQGEAGAKSYLVAPGATVALWDSESQSIYVKSADTSGIPSTKILDYKIREPQTNTAHAQMSEYATRDELNMLKKDLQDFRTKYEDLLKCEEVLK